MCTQQKLSTQDRRVNNFCPAKGNVRWEESKYSEWTHERHSVRLEEVSIKQEQVGDA